MAVAELVDSVVSFVREHESWAAPVAFLVAFAESFCFLSILWPGTAILAGITLLMASSGISQDIVIPTIVGASLGGVFGYSVSYWIGLYFKDSIDKIWPFSSRPYLIDRGKEFFEKYGAFGVFLGHFFGPVRAVIPVVAGMFAMRQLPFQIANIASAVIWAAGVIAPAFFLVTFKEDVFTLMRDYEGAVALVLFALAVANAVPRPFFFVPTLALFVLVGAFHIFAGGNFFPVWLAGAAGALVGDLNAYRVGKRYQGNLKGAWPWTAHPASRARARAMIDELGVPAVLVSKFRGFNRGLVPLMAGAIELKPLAFLVASVTSALLWSGVLFLPAIAIGLIAR
jgi:membrane protein DedA with SNARE-associated domain